MSPATPTVSLQLSATKGNPMNKTFATLTTACFAGALVLGGATVANATNDKDHKVTICHATSSETNPWVTITVARAALKAHEGHGDLIPAPPGGCPVPVVVVPPVDVPVDPIDPVDPVDPIDPPTEEPVDPPVDVPEEPTPETPVEEPTEPEIPVATSETPVEEVPAAFVPQQLPTLPATELAYTGGSSPLIPAGVASLLMAAGAFLLRRKVRA